MFSFQIFRPFNIYGLGQNSSFLIPKIIDQLKSGKIVLDDPNPRRDFIYVQDIISAILLSLEYSSTNYGIFNLGYGISYSVDELVHLIKKAFNSNARIIYSSKPRINEVLNTVANVNKAKIYAANQLEWRST